MRLSELYSDISEFEDLLDAAETNASTEWEMDFMFDLRERYKKYKNSMFLSPKQKETLENLAEGKRKR